MGFKKIIKGMPDGAEAIQSNFEIISPNYKSTIYLPNFEEGFKNGWGGETKAEIIETATDITININIAIEGTFKSNLWTLTSKFETLAKYLKEQSDAIDYGCFASILRFGGIGQGGKGSFHQLNLESGELHSSAAVDNQKNIIGTFQVNFKKKQK